MQITLEQCTRDQFSKDIRQFENKTHYGNDIKLTKVRQDTYEMDMKDNTNNTADP